MVKVPPSVPGGTSTQTTQIPDPGSEGRTETDRAGTETPLIVTLTPGGTFPGGPAIKTSTQTDAPATGVAPEEIEMASDCPHVGQAPIAKKQMMRRPRNSLVTFPILRC